MKRVLRQWLAGLLSVVLAFALLPATALAADFDSTVSGGGNSAEDPYQIENAEQLRKLSEYVKSGHNCQNKHFKLMGDIDLGGADNPWTPIGNSDTSFKGTFDGDGHTVSGLYIDGSSIDNVGLLGYIGSGGTVKNLGVSGEINNGGSETGGIAGRNYGTITGCHSACDISSGDNVGGIVGINRGTVKDCYNVGKISGSDAGGIAGINYITVSGCYNAGSVNGSSNAGGIAGRSTDQGFIIENCYNVGTVTGGTAGGIAGKNDQVGTGGSITNCYFLESTANNGVGSGGATGVDQKSEDQFRSLASELGGDWIDDPFLGRPVLKSNQEPWEGTEGQLCEIPDKATLEKVRNYINNSADGGKGKTFKLTQNINLQGDAGNPWTPIGNDSDHRFKGTFDGGNFTVSGLYINSNSNNQGLFGFLSGGTVKNLTVIGSVTGGEQTGGIAGLCELSSIIENCVNKCTIKGSLAVGGITGKCNGGTIKGCINTGDISASVDYGGGIAGDLDPTGTVVDCYNTGGVNSGAVAGGIVGDENGTVSNCYNTGSVSCNDPNERGSIAGGVYGTVENCYYLDTSCDVAGGGTAKSVEEFASGEVAWLLQGEQSDQVWGQSLKDEPDNYPVLTDTPAKKVYKVTFCTESNPAYDAYDAKYTNTGGTVALPEKHPALDGTVFDHWAINDLNGDTFNEQTTVTENMTVCAVGKETFGGESDVINLETIYGNSLTEDLSKHVAYKLETPTAGKFTYTIDGGNDDQLNAGISGDNLNIPGTANAGDYKLTIKAEEQTPQYSLMSVDNYGTDSVTLTVNITIKKADPEVTPPTGNTLTYTGAEQELVTAGTATGGTMQYSLDQNGEYSADIPKGTEAKEYTVWYKVVGDDNHNDTEPASLTVTIGKAEAGRGSVSMADYTCGDNSVNPEAKSDTNGTDNVEFTYSVKGQNDYKAAKPTTAGEYTVRAVFPAANGYDEVTATADFRITHKYPENWDGTDFLCSCSSDLRLDVEGLTQVPPGLIGTYGDVGALTRALVEQVDTGANYAVYDVKLEVKRGGEAWHNAPEGSIPASGITVTLPYPKGTDSSYTFTVVHMFASGANAGNTETPAVTNGADGLTVTLSGLSPVCVGWTAPPSGSSGSYPSYYSVAVPSGFEGGNITADRASARQGSKVTLTVKPDEGYHFGSLAVSDRNGKPVEVTDNGNGTYTFTMPYGQVTVKAEFVKCGSLDFTDLDIKAWYHDYTDYVINHGLMHGVGGGLFAPDGTVNRAQMVTVLWNMSGKPVVNYYMTYSDVAEGVWYSEAIRWATSEGIVGGYGGGLFGPDDPITREQMAAMIYRYEQKYGDGGFTGDWMYRLPFTDLDQISDWAFEAVAWCNMEGVITGKDSNIFDPKGPAKRSEMAAILTRYLTQDK